jgi:hypothetical protein
MVSECIMKQGIIKEDNVEIIHAPKKRPSSSNSSSGNCPTTLPVPLHC